MITLQGTPEELVEFAELLALKEHSLQADVKVDVKEESVAKQTTELSMLTFRVSEFRSRFLISTRDRTAAVIVQQRLKLLVEEFFEVLEACGVIIPQDVRTLLDDNCEISPGIHGDNQLVRLARELADLDYVVEGFRQDFNVPEAEVAEAVYVANMRKCRTPSGEIVKPPNWVSPDGDIAAALRVASQNLHK